MVVKFFSKLYSCICSYTANVACSLKQPVSELLVDVNWRYVVHITYLFAFVAFSNFNTFTDFMAWLLVAFFVELFTYFYPNTHFRAFSFVFYFATLLLIVVASNIPIFCSVLLPIFSFFFSTDLTSDLVCNSLYTSSVFSNFIINTQFESPNNFILHFYKYYSAQSCGILSDFTPIIESGFHVKRLILTADSPQSASIGFHYIMDSDSNPFFFTLYNLNFFSYEVLLFLATILILFLGLFFYNAYTYSGQLSYTSKTEDSGYDILYRFNEVLLLAVLSLVHFSQYKDFIDSVNTFGYSFVFNNLFSIHPAQYTIKCCVVFLFLFFNFFFRLHSYIILKFGTSSTTPMELPFLLMSILTFCSILLSSNDFNLLLICLEGITFIISVIIAFDATRSSAVASIKYFTLGVASSGFFSMASAVTYGLLLSLDFKSITDFFYFTDALTSEFMPVFVFTAALITLSFFIKLSVFPGNFWVLDIYNGCSFPIISVLVLLKALYFIIFAKLYFSIYAFCSGFLFPLIVSASIGSMLFSSYGLLTELHLKQFVAYSSTGQFGFLLLTLVCYQDSATFLSIFVYLFYYITVMLIFFFSISHLSSLGAIDKLTDLTQCRGSSITTFFLVISLLSLAGLPPFFGFFAKINILLNLAAAGLSAECLFIVFLLNIAMSFGYIRAIRVLYFNFTSPFGKNSRIKLEEDEESVIYFSNLAISKIHSNFFLKFSYFFYFGIVQFFVFVQIFGFYFFGYVIHYIPPVLSTAFLL